MDLKELICPLNPTQGPYESMRKCCIEGAAD